MKEGGYSFEPKGLSIAPKTLANFLDRKTQLYEQGADVRRTGNTLGTNFFHLVVGYRFLTYSEQQLEQLLLIALDNQYLEV